MIKFPTDYGVRNLRGDQVATQECYIVMMEMDDHLQAMNIEEHQTVAEPIERLEEILLDDSKPNQMTRIGTFASLTVYQTFTTFLIDNRDIFASNHEDMSRIDPLVMVHRLNVSPSFLPIYQKKRVFVPKRDQTIAEEVHKLQKVNFIREVYYLD